MVGAPSRPRPLGPEIPADIEVRDLDREVRAELRSLPKGASDTVARHLVAAGRFLDSDPARALEHAQAARQQAARIASVREAVGLAAYHAGEWRLAIAELRAYRRFTGSDVHLAVIADSERALGRPEKAIELAGSPEAAQLDTETRVELLIVAAGARQDQGDLDGAITQLEVPELRSGRPASWQARLRYAYAELLLAAGRVDEAREWFVQAADVDSDGVTDAGERVLDLDGFLFTDESDDEDEFLDGSARDEQGDSWDDDADDADDADDEGEPDGLDADGTPVAEDEDSEILGGDVDGPVAHGHDGKTRDQGAGGAVVDPHGAEDGGGGLRGGQDAGGAVLDAQGADAEGRGGESAGGVVVDVLGDGDGENPGRGADDCAVRARVLADEPYEAIDGDEAERSDTADLVGAGVAAGEDGEIVGRGDVQDSGGGDDGFGRSGGDSSVGGDGSDTNVDGSDGRGSVGDGAGAVADDAVSAVTDEDDDWDDDEDVVERPTDEELTASVGESDIDGGAPERSGADGDSSSAGTGPAPTSERAVPSRTASFSDGENYDGGDGRAG
ncbi:tetratricopeptide repeat protein [Cryptosporangium aurantiacum]|uniref:Tetratricopeptide repeat-containing protein n=1 Tax=Cryptosporangium aurantiacum TaxID=134849 RepID=A0A1M7RNG2_9ACTN|nr:tetratricopeptide repeat protein [Cryptosporangium aurantiacum]SHN47843.1 hypothetical protein SAMN05443668_1293 [Cryptosporangium aurantiacum]